MKWKTFPDKSLVNTLMNIDYNGEAIDVGCASGADALYLVNSGFEKVTAVDKDISQILDEVSHNPNIEVIKDEYENVIKDNSYDFIVSRFSAFRVEQVELLIKALKDNGHLFLKVLGDKISKYDLEKIVSNYEYSLKTYESKDNHPPLGEHTHNILFVLLCKKEKVEE
jgi:cyclopropane fatty-acyl-phospholipid synthase-like methyltransferase